jgi:hypothetical protein
MHLLLVVIADRSSLTFIHGELKPFISYAVGLLTPKIGFANRNKIYSGQFNPNQTKHQ